tara:strand:- start:3790 stop:4191 length:402 start_codon:yes stop_codon:yes gene_type:complete
MGTRSLTKIISTHDDKPITCMYRQYDGYLEGHGVELAEWLEKFTVVNGIGLDETRKIANGMECLAAQMFENFKDEAGGIYCYHPDASDCGEEYLYEISEKNGDIIMTVINTWEDEVVFKGSTKELLTKLKENA